MENINFNSATPHKNEGAVDASAESSVKLSTEQMADIGRKAIGNISNDDMVEKASRKNLQDIIRTRWDLYGNGVYRPIKYEINMADVEDFLEAPEDELVASRDERGGDSPWYYHTYNKSKVSTLIVKDKVTLEGYSEVGSLQRQENGEFIFKPYEIPTRKLDALHDFSEALGISAEELTYDKIDEDLVIHEGHPVVPRNKNRENIGKITDDMVEILNSNPYESRLETRIDNQIMERQLNLKEVGGVLVDVSWTREIYLACPSSDMDKRVEQITKLTDALGLGDTREAKLWKEHPDWSLFDHIDSSRIPAAQNDVKEWLQNEKTALSAADIVRLAQTGMEDARWLCRRYTAIEEKTNYEELIEKPRQL